MVRFATQQDVAVPNTPVASKCLDEVLNLLDINKSGNTNAIMYSETGGLIVACFADKLVCIPSSSERIDLRSILESIELFIAKSNIDLNNILLCGFENSIASDLITNDFYTITDWELLTKRFILKKMLQPRLGSIPIRCIYGYDFLCRKLIIRRASAFELIAISQLASHSVNKVLCEPAALVQNYEYLNPEYIQVALADNKLVGFVLWSPDKHNAQACHLRAVYVLSDFQTAHLDAQLLNAAYERMSLQGFSAVYCYVGAKPPALVSEYSMYLSVCDLHFNSKLKTIMQAEDTFLFSNNC